MNKEINGQIVYSLGVNNYSYGMELLVFNAKTITPLEIVKMSEMWLNPTAEPNSLEIFAIRGSFEQFIKLYTSQAETWEYRYKEKFVPWYTKLGIAKFQVSTKYYDFIIKE